MSSTEIAEAVASLPAAVAQVIVRLVSVVFYQAPAMARAGAFAAPIEYLTIIVRDNAPANYVGRCKSCRKAFAVTDVVRAGARLRDTHRSFDIVHLTPDGRVFRSIDNGSNACAFHAVCKCGAWVTVRKVDGKFTEHACNGKCMASTGPSCECACGGKNHGRSHA